jgi:hypothetical protein
MKTCNDFAGRTEQAKNKMFAASIAPNGPNSKNQPSLANVSKIAMIQSAKCGCESNKTENTNSNLPAAGNARQIKFLLQTVARMARRASAYYNTNQ